MNQSTETHKHLSMKHSHLDAALIDDNFSHCRCKNFNLYGIFDPIIRVIPTDDWSKIKAIWIPLLHHDYLNQLQRSENITILQASTDKFGTIQGFLTAPHENYIPYLTTFFNPTWTKNMVLEQIVQASNNIIESIHTVVDTTDVIIKKTVMGRTTQGMIIMIVFDQDQNIIDASPLFDKE